MYIYMCVCVRVRVCKINRYIYVYKGIDVSLVAPILSDLRLTLTSFLGTRGAPLRVNPSAHKPNTTNDHTKDHPPHLTTIEGGATTVRTTFHARVNSCGRCNPNLISQAREVLHARV